MAMTQNKTIFIYLSLGRSSGLRIEKYEDTIIYELYYLSRKRIFTELRKSLKRSSEPRTKYIKTRLFKEIK